MFRKNIYLFMACIMVLFLCCGVSFGFSLFGDGLNYEDIYVIDFENSVTNYTHIFSDGSSTYGYLYDVGYWLENFSTSLEGSEVVTYLYDGDNILLFNDTSTMDDVFNDDDLETTGESNNTTQYISDVGDDSNRVYVKCYYPSDDIINVTHVKIEVIKDGSVVFNTTQPFNMSNYEEDQIDIGASTSSDEETNNFNSDNGATYVASSDSNKFHEPYCSQAQRIHDANKITFSSRDEAINSGYEPCEICYP